MRKTRIYLDTSPIIMIEPDQDPRRQAITKEFFRIMAEKSEEYELFVSPVTLEELRAGTHERNKESIAFLDAMKHEELPDNDEAENLAWIYATDGVLSQAHIDDLRHVAYAVVSRCDYIATWNMRHLANPRTIRRVADVNALENYAKIFITTPEHFTGEANDEQ